MKRLLVIVLIGCVFVISHSSRAVAADEGDTDGLPLSALNGTYSFTAHGSFFFCFKETPPFPPAKCGSLGSSGVPVAALDVVTVTINNGISCATFTETDSHLPVEVSPPLVQVDGHSVHTVTNYDPATGT